MRRWKRVLVLAPLGALLLAGCVTVSKMDSMGGPMSANFSVKIEVLDGSSTPIAPAAWAVYTGDNPLCKLNTATRIKGLEALAEDGDPGGVVRALSDSMGVVASGVANTPVGSASPGPALPGKAVSGDITMYVSLFDDGTEKNEQPGTGPHQAPRQGMHNSGMDEMGTVRRISDVADGFMYPAVEKVIRVVVSAM